MNLKIRKLTLIILCIHSVILLYAQSEKGRYEIYSEVLKVEFEKVRTHGNRPVKIMLIDQYVEEYESGVEEFLKYDVDTVNQEIYTSILPKEILIDRLRNERLLRKTLKNFAENFENHPILQLNLLEIGDAEIQSISTKKFNSYFKKWQIRNIEQAWKRIEKKYQTQFMMEFSKIHFEGNFAAIYYNLHCGSLCGFRKTVLLEKGENR